jgi:predicted Ser/Thr protein kinase
MASASSPVPIDTARAARDQQDRVGRFGAAVFTISALLGVASIGSHLATQGQASESGGLLHELVHVASVLPALGVWLRCRGAPLSPRAVDVLDAGLTIVACVLFALLGLSATASLSVAFSVVLALTYTLVGRSILVVSSFRRTLWIGAVSTAPTIGYFTTQSVAAALGQSELSGQIFITFGTLWCVFAVLASAANSRQLYGLREQIREIRKLGQYTLEEKIGEGGMGAVYRATHAMLRRPAAIKLLSKQRASEQDQMRFEREVQLTSRLAHPNTISIFDYGHSADGVFYYVMEYLDGFDLERLVQAEGPLQPSRVIHILTQVCAALGEAHALGLIHRDIKPANIVLTERVDEPDVVKVVDFGLVKTLETNGADSRTGAIVGTPMYLAPEAILSPGTVDARTDIYALGAVAYFLLAGRNVFDAESVVGVIGKHLATEPEAPSAQLGKALPADLEALVLQCLAKDPAARPASAAALASALLACGDAARYDRASACAWWRARGTRLRAGKSAAASGSGATVAIDLRGRQDAAGAA